jgi:peroxiredoxin
MSSKGPTLSPNDHEGDTQDTEDPCETPPVADPEESDEDVSAKKEPDRTSDRALDADESASEREVEASDASRPDVAKKRPKKSARRAGGPSREPPVNDTAKAFGPIAHLGFVVVAAIGVYSFVSVAKEGELRRRCTPTCILRPNYAGYERRAPSFSLKDTKGRDVSLASFKGKVVVLNFWTKTCGPCMEEMPEIADLSRILKPLDDVAVVTISTDETAQEATETLKSVLREEAPFPVLMDPEAKVVKGMFGTSLYPETWIIDKDGVIRARFDGAREWSSATVVELVNQIRAGGYCPAQARDGKFVNESVRLCEGMSGG